MQTNVISLEPRLSISRFRSSAIDVASPRRTVECIEPSSSPKSRESNASDSIDVQMGIKECRKLTGLLSHEVLLGVSPSPRHRAALRGYSRLCHGNSAEVQAILIHDLRSYLEIGARHFAADQLIVLRLFLTDRLGVLPRRSVSLPEAKVIKLSESRRRR